MTTTPDTLIVETKVNSLWTSRLLRDADGSYVVSYHNGVCEQPRQFLHKGTTLHSLIDALVQERDANTPEAQA